MNIIQLILSPPFLTNHINLIALIISGILIMLVESKVLEYLVFPVADFVKKRTSAGLSHIKSSKILSEGLATLIFIIYTYIGVSLMSQYILAPILYGARAVITLIIIGLFLLLSYMLNNHSLRNKFFR